MALLNERGVERLWMHITSKLGSKVDKIDGKVLSTNDYTDEEKNKLINATAGVDSLNILVGDTSVSDQITNAIEDFETTTIEYVDKKFSEVPEFDPTGLQGAIDTNTLAIGLKVDKVDGMGLSTNDYTTAEKDKLATIEDNANFYEHPVHDSHSLGLYKITVDDSGHVSSATLVGKEDIVTLGIPAQDTTYEEEIEGLNGRIDDVEDDIRIIINETLNGLSEEFENYKEINNKAVSTNTGDIEANKLSIEGIVVDYLKLSDKTQLQDDISQVSGRVTDNEDAIKILKGDGDGSIKKSIDNAFNEFSANVTNDDVINTYKELIDYAATHGPEFAGLVGEVDTVKIDVGEMEINFSDYKTEVSECFANTDLKIDGHITNVNNPHNVTKTQIGLENVDNTSDLEKPISNAVQEALEEKANFNHDHNELYYTKDEISESITVEDIDNICGSNNGDDFDFVRIATEDWVQANYQIKGNYLTEVPDEYLRNDELQSAIDTALAKAKEGGEFDGEKGDKGDKGDQGDQGEPGTNGADGYSPVRGTDYWTDADIAQIKSYVDDAILGGAW